MFRKKWCNLKRINENYQLQPGGNVKTKCSSRVNFTQLAFESNGEQLIATDTTGDLYYIDVSNTPCYQKLKSIGHATFAAFNPANRFEILLGLVSGDIKIIGIGMDATHSCLLAAHNSPPLHVSFYKNYCLTSSNKEVIIWHLNSYAKAHQLRINVKEAVVKKAAFSNLGHIVVLYYNNTLQAWFHRELETDVKIDATVFGMHNVKDFAFTTNGRAMILGGVQSKIVILNTCTWSLLRKIRLPDSIIAVKQLCVVPLPLDGGANKVLAITTSHCSLHFFDLNLCKLVDTTKAVKVIKKLAISPTGRYIAYINQEGTMHLMFAEKLFLEKCPEAESTKRISRPIAHCTTDHLQCVRKIMQRELRLGRLLPILKEFGEYPEKHRTIIWSTILKLPANKEAYIALANKASCTKFTLKILEDYHLQDKNKRTLLTMTVNQLVQWCPLLAQSTFLPNLVFPFLMAFKSNPLLAFELILTVLLNYCQKWFEYHPLPPLNVLGIIENILLEADPTLLNILCERGITSTEYAWPLLKTAMSEVLPGPEWLILWDHLISFKKTSLLLMCIVAYSICTREIILSTLHSVDSFKQFYTTQGHIRAKDIITIAQQLDDKISSRIHPRRYLRDDLITVPRKGPYPPFILDEYPKYLTEDFSILQLDKLKEKERRIQSRSRKMMEAAEQKRLYRETQNFIDEIHQARLNEAQMCIKEQAYEMDRRLDRAIHESTEEDSDQELRSKQPFDVPPLDIGQSDESDVNDNTPETCERLQRNVDKLENEVQMLLSSLRSQKFHKEFTVDIT